MGLLGVPLPSAQVLAAYLDEDDGTPMSGNENYHFSKPSALLLVKLKPGTRPHATVAARSESRNRRFRLVPLISMKLNTMASQRKYWPRLIAEIQIGGGPGTVANPAKQGTNSALAGCCAAHQTAAELIRDTKNTIHGSRGQLTLFHRSTLPNLYRQFGAFIASILLRN